MLISQSCVVFVIKNAVFTTQCFVVLIAKKCAVLIGQSYVVLIIKNADFISQCFVVLIIKKCGVYEMTLRPNTLKP